MISHLIVPLNGFSDHPRARGMNPVRIAELFMRLMRDELGYQRFGAQGGDWGSSITSRLGYAYPQQLIGIHLNMLPPGWRHRRATAWAIVLKSSTGAHNGSTTSRTTGPIAVSRAHAHRRLPMGSMTRPQAWPAGSSKSSAPGAIARAMWSEPSVKTNCSPTL
ncbi:MAG TPA: hypothetical protein VF043_34680 [Ktedonobacteraceae bacterium]